MSVSKSSQQKCRFASITSSAKAATTPSTAAIKAARRPAGVHFQGRAQGRRRQEELRRELLLRRRERQERRWRRDRGPTQMQLSVDDREAVSTDMDRAPAAKLRTRPNDCRVYKCHLRIVHMCTFVYNI